MRGKAQRRLVGEPVLLHRLRVDFQLTHRLLVLHVVVEGNARRAAAANQRPSPEEFPVLIVGSNLERLRFDLIGVLVVLPTSHVIDEYAQSVARTLIPKIRPGSDHIVAGRWLIDAQNDRQLASRQYGGINSLARAEPHVLLAPRLVDLFPRIVFITEDLLWQRKRVIGRLAVGCVKSGPIRCECPLHAGLDAFHILPEPDKFESSVALDQGNVARTARCLISDLVCDEQWPAGDAIGRDLLDLIALEA